MFSWWSCKAETAEALKDIETLWLEDQEGQFSKEKKEKPQQQRHQQWQQQNRKEKDKKMKSKSEMRRAFENRDDKNREETKHPKFRACFPN